MSVGQISEAIKKKGLNLTESLMTPDDYPVLGNSRVSHQELIQFEGGHQVMLLHGRLLQWKHNARNSEHLELRRLRDNLE